MAVVKEGEGADILFLFSCVDKKSFGGSIAYKLLKFFKVCDEDLLNQKPKRFRPKAGDHLKKYITLYSANKNIKINSVELINNEQLDVEARLSVTLNTKLTLLDDRFAVLIGVARLTTGVVLSTLTAKVIELFVFFALSTAVIVSVLFVP